MAFLRTGKRTEMRYFSLVLAKRRDFQNTSKSGILYLCTREQIMSSYKAARCTRLSAAQLLNATCWLPGSERRLYSSYAQTDEQPHTTDDEVEQSTSMGVPTLLLCQDNANP